jgi:hypothetical protein
VRIFVSYSFQNAWIEEYVIPLIACFGHEPVTGRILDGSPLPEEVRAAMRTCRRVLCFVTRSSPLYGPGGQTTGFRPPDWVHDEMLMARGANTKTVEFRETGVSYEGSAQHYPWHEFDRDQLPKLLLRLAQLLKTWPVGPLQLRLTVPQELYDDFSRGVAMGNFVATCAARDSSEAIVFEEEEPVRLRDNQFVVLFWIKPDPNLAIDLEIRGGPRKLVCRGVAPAICDARLLAIG